MDVLANVKRIANNALYFADNRDYELALWEILLLVAPELRVEDCTPDLGHIEDAHPGTKDEKQASA